MATPVFDGAKEGDIMDTLDLANDYVNLEWEEFEKKHKEELLPEVMEYLSENRDHREVWTSRTRMNLIIYQMMQFQIVHVANRYRRIEIFTRSAVAKPLAVMVTKVLFPACFR